MFIPSHWHTLYMGRQFVVRLALTVFAQQVNLSVQEFLDQKTHEAHLRHTR